MDSPVLQDDTTSISDITEYIEDSITGSLRPTNCPKSLGSRKRSASDEVLWAQTRPRDENEPERDKHYHLLFYCKHCCPYFSPTGQRFREHLFNKYRIRIPVY
jgi:hypothetical protein